MGTLVLFRFSSGVCSGFQSHEIHPDLLVCHLCDGFTRPTYECNACWFLGSQHGSQAPLTHLHFQPLFRDELRPQCAKDNALGWTWTCTHLSTSKAFLWISNIELLTFQVERSDFRTYTNVFPSSRRLIARFSRDLVVRQLCTCKLAAKTVALVYKFSFCKLQVGHG